ncbi:MAG: hypothetical protein M3537_07165, partial [Chloroflexota bacterium]|nr:hypothetical protein [Chloroflexota bacterium]
HANTEEPKMTTTKLTPSQTALMTQIARNGFSFFDEGLVAGSGIWSDALTHETGPDVAKNPRGAARVMTSLCVKGLLFSDKASYSAEDGAWVELTEAGAEWIAAHNEAKAAEQVADDALEATLEIGEDGNYVLPSAAPVQEELPIAEETPAPAKKTRKAKAKKAVAAPETTETVAEEPTAPETAPEPETAAPTAEELGYTVEEWDEETDEWGTQFWIQTVFADGSMTLRRRRKVSGAWRTDFWGQAAGAEKRVFTTSGAAKAARAAKKFTV